MSNSLPDGKPSTYIPEYCYGCGKIRICGKLPCDIVRCERCIKKHIEKCDACSKELYVDGDGKLQEIIQPKPEEPRIISA